MGIVFPNSFKYFNIQLNCGESQWQVSDFTRVNLLSPITNLISSATISKIDERGRILIPAEFREKLNLNLNTGVLISLENNHLEIAPANGTVKEKIIFNNLDDVLKFLSAKEDFITLNVKKKNKKFILEVLTRGSSMVERSTVDLGYGEVVGSNLTHGTKRRD